MTELEKKAVEALIERRKRLSKEYDELISEPESYGISGSVNATNRKLNDLRKEMSACEQQIRRLTGGGIFDFQLANYRNQWWRD